MRVQDRTNISNDSTPLSLDEFICFANDFVALQLHFLWQWMLLHPAENFREALRKRIDLCRKTDPAPKHFDIASTDFNRPAWLAIEDDLALLYEKQRKRWNAVEFEQAALARVTGEVTRFAKLTYNSKFKMSEYQCGSLKYDQPSKKTPQLINFHIGNAIAPKSIFADKSYLKDCFLDMMDQTQSKYGADTLKTGTWLNSMPKWLSYFPQEWMDNMSPANKDVQWHYGFWGQFISAKGDLNRKYAEQLRATGEFPFWLRSSHCSFTAMRKHLDSWR